MVHEERLDSERHSNHCGWTADMENSVEEVRSRLFDWVENGLEGCQLGDFERALDEVGDIGIRDNDNNTLLHLAVCHRRYQIAEILFKKGADVDAQNFDGDSPKTLARNTLELSEMNKIERKTLLNIVRRSAEDEERALDTGEKRLMDISDDEMESILAESKDGGCSIGDIEWDDMKTIARQLGVSPHSLENLGMDICTRIRNYRDSEGNTLLIQLASNGKPEMLDFILQCEAIDINAKNYCKKTASDICWEMKEYVCLVKLLEADALFPNDFDVAEIDELKEGSTELASLHKEREELHNCIKSDNFEYVMEATSRLGSSYYLNCKNQSALWCAAKSMKVIIFRHLMSIDARFKDKTEMDDNDVKSMGIIFEEYFEESDDAHLLRMISSTKVYPKFTKSCKAVVRAIYELLDKSEYVAALMKDLQHEYVEIMMDFGRDHVGRMLPREPDAFGMTDLKSQKIYIGAKTCISAEELDSKVVGTIAHEICHMAMQIVYKNEGKPYSDNERENEFEEIVTELAQRNDELHEIIQLVFNHPEEIWHAEMIVRVPHLLMMLGDKNGRDLLKKQAPKLYKYFTAKVIPDCIEYSKDIFFKKPIVLSGNLHKYLGCISEIETDAIRLKEPLENFEEYLSPCSNVFILKTSNAKLGRLHVYQNLKRKYRLHLDKCCMLFEWECFQENSEEILNAYRSTVCKYLVLVCEDDKLSLKKITHYFPKVISDRKKVILIVEEGCEDLPFLGICKIIGYGWDTLSEFTRTYLLGIKVEFQSIQMKLGDLVNEQLACEIIGSKELSYLMKSGIEIGNKWQMNSEDYDPEYFVERSFCLKTLDISSNMEKMNDVIYFITGMGKKKFGRIFKNTVKVQVLQHMRDKVYLDGGIVLWKGNECGTEDSAKIFNGIDFCGIVVWLQYQKGRFVCRRSKGSSEEILKPLTFSTKMLIKECKQGRAIIVADDPGSGKSTVMTDIIKKIKKKMPGDWIIRLNLNDLAVDAGKPYSLLNLPTEYSSCEVVSRALINILQIRNPLEVSLFKKFCKLRSKIKFFIDAVDEICPSYWDVVSKFLQALKNKTKLQLWITTRPTEQNRLEDIMGVFSYTIVPLSINEQEEFLRKYWFYKFKCCKIDNSQEVCEKEVEMIGKSIETLHSQIRKQFYSHKTLEDIGQLRSVKQATKFNISSINIQLFNSAQMLLKGIKEYIGDKLFMGMPLQLHMLADEISEVGLKTRENFSLFSLYSQFIERQITRYLKEKCKMIVENQGWQSVYEKMKNEYITAHQIVAVKELEPNLNVLETIPDNIHAIGLLSIAKKFKHRTYAEYFFALWLFNNLKNEEVQSVFLEKVMVKLEYKVVRHFLNYKFQYPDKNIVFSDKALKRLKLQELCKLCGRYDGNEFMHILPYLICNIEKVHERSEIKEHFIHLAECIFRVEKFKFESIFHILERCLSKGLLVEIFNANNFHNKNPLFYSVNSHYKGTIKEKLICLKRVLKSKIKDYLMLVDYLDSSILHLSVTYETFEEFESLLRFVHDLSIQIDSGESFHQLLMKVDHAGDNILLFCFGRVTIEKFTSLMGVLCDLGKQVDGGETFYQLLMKVNGIGESVLHKLTRYPLEHSFEEFLKVFDSAHVTNEKIKILILKKCDSFETILCKYVTFGDGETTVDILRVIRKYLDDDNSFQNFIMNANNNGNTFLHNAGYMRKNNFFCKILIELNDILSKSAFFQLVIKSNSKGETFLHLLVLYSCREVFIEVVKSMKSLLEIEQFAEFFTKQNNYGETILHVANKCECIKYIDLILDVSMNSLKPDLLFKFLGKKDSKGNTFFHLAMCFYDGSYEEQRDIDLNVCLQFAQNNWSLKVIKNLLIVPNKSGDTFLHVVAEFGTFVGLCQTVNFLFEKFGSELCRKLFMSHDNNGRNILHAMARNKYFKIDERYVPIIKHLLNGENILELLERTDEMGNTFLHLAAKYRTLLFFLKELTIWREEYAIPLNFREFFRMCNQKGQTLLHIHTENLGIYQNLGKFKMDCYSEILTKEDANGNTILHILSRNKFDDEIMAVLNEAKDVLPPESFLGFIKKINTNGDTFLHVAVAWQCNLCEIFRLCKQYVDKHFFWQIFTQTNKEGNNIVHLAAGNHFIVMKHILEAAKGHFDDEGFNKFVSSCNIYGDTVLHLSCDCMSREIWSAHSSIVRKSFKHLVFHKNNTDETILHVSARNKDANTLLRIMNDLLSDDELTELLNKTNNKGRTFLHTAIEGHYAKVFQSIPCTLDDFIKSGTLRQYLEESNRKVASLQEILPFEDPDEIRHISHIVVDSISALLYKSLFDQKDALGTNVYVCRFGYTLCAVGKRSKEGLSNLINAVDFNGDTFLHIAALKTGPGYVREIVKFVMKFLGEDSLRELFLKQNDDGNNILMMAAKNNSAVVLCYMLRIASTIFKERDFEKLVRMRNKKGGSVFHESIEGRNLVDRLVRSDICEEFICKKLFYDISQRV